MSMARITKESHTHDLRIQQILSSARPLFLFAFQRHMAQLRIMLECPFCCSPPPATAIHASAIDLHVRPSMRSSAILCSSLSITVAVRLLSIRGLSRDRHALNAGACILSRLHHLPGRLGAVASLGAGIVREFDLPRRPFCNCCQCQYSGLAFDSCNNLVVCKRWGVPFEVCCYHNGSPLRDLAAISNSCPRSGLALDDAGHVIICGEHEVRVLRYSDASCMLTITQPPHSSPLDPGRPLPEYDDESISDDDDDVSSELLFTGDVDTVCHKRSASCMLTITQPPHSSPLDPGRPLPEYVSDDDESISDDDDDVSSELLFTGDVDTVCHKQFQPRSVAVDSDGNIAVYDSGNGVVKVFRSSDGGLLRTIGGRSSGYRPLSPCEQCGIAFDMEGNLVVTDFYHADSHKKHNHLLVLRYSDGAVIRVINLPNVQPVGIAFDGAGHVVVVDFLHFVHVLRYSDGQFVRSIPIQSRSYIEGSVAIDPCGRIVLVVDRRVVVVE